MLTFDLPVGNHKTVDLRLHFVELYWGAPDGGPAGPGKRIFDVDAEEVTVLGEFDITRAAGAARRAVVVPIEKVAVGDKRLTLRFTARKDFPAVSAIEVFARD